ncbi:YciI family protein [Psychromonas sp. CD1]|uniref:YciI family protein n=1 Tax=Psychromonas sp. CD1 TaxID=1979839 RepID=UPI000B9A868F|nr:YciI family protein [Psychromonas sp. CD1]
MLYIIFSEDIKNSLALRITTRDAHLARLQTLLEQNRLVVAGPNPAIDNNDPGEAGFTGSTVIAEFNSLEEAQSWADADPYQKAGVYASVRIKPFKQVLPLT